MPFDLKIFNKSDEIREKSAEWIAFSDDCQLAAPFCGARVWTAWLCAFDNIEPSVYEWYKGGELRAIIPPFRRKNHLEMAAGPHLDYQDIAARSDADAAEALSALITTERDRSGVLVFPKVRSDSRLARALSTLRQHEESRLENRFWSQCPVSTIHLQAKDDFLAAIPIRQRKDYRNASRRIAESFPDHQVEHFGPGQIPVHALEAAANLHQENQYRKSGSSVFADSRYRSFLSILGASNSPLGLSLLREHPDGPLLSFHLGFWGTDTFYDYLTAYAGQHANLSAGRWLLIDLLRHHHQRINTEILHLDMLCGEESYKFRWPTTTYSVMRHIVLPWRLSNLPRIIGYSALYGLKNVRNRHLLNRPDPIPINTADPIEVILPR